MTKTLVISGKVDIGKTTLIEKLTGRQMMLHSFELEKSITLKINSASFWVSNSQLSSKGVGDKYQIIDIPGHRNLLTNSIVNFAYADTVIHLISPEDRDLEALEMLFLQKKFYGFDLIIIQNKVDIYPVEKCIESYDFISNALTKNNVDISAIIPLSSLYDINYDVLLSSFSSQNVLKPISSGVNVLRSYDINKPGRFSSVSGGILGIFNKDLDIYIGQSLKVVQDGQEIPFTIREIFDQDRNSLSSGPYREIITIKTSLPPSLTGGDNLRGARIYPLDEDISYSKEFVFEESFSFNNDSFNVGETYLFAKENVLFSGKFLRKKGRKNYFSPITKIEKNILYDKFICFNFKDRKYSIFKLMK